MDIYPLSYVQELIAINFQNPLYFETAYIYPTTQFNQIHFYVIIMIIIWFVG